MLHRLGGKCGVTVCVVVPVCLVLLGCGALAADWPQWRGSNRDGISAETLTVTNWPPLLAWSNSIAIGESALAVSEGRVYTMGRSGPTNFVYCLDASTGTNIWTQTYLTNGSLVAYGSYGPQATPTVSSNEVYTFDDGGKLYCFNRTNGTVQWNTALNLKRPQYAYSSSPLVEGDLIFLNGSGAGAAVSKTTHNLVWPTGTLSVGTGYASAIGMTVDGKRLILFQTASALKAVTTNGVVAWSYAYDSASMSGYAAADPVVWGDKVLLYENGLVLLKATTNSVSEVWTLNTDQSGASFSTPVIVGSYAYAINNVGELVRIALSDGTVDWNMAVSDYYQGALTAADGKLIVLADGKLRVVKIGASGFDEGGRTPVTVCAPDMNYAWSPPALYNGKIYCRVGQTLACYSISGLLPGPSLSIDTGELVVMCPAGTLVTQVVDIVNAGDATLTWSLSDVFTGTNFTRIVRQFKSGWTKFGTSPSMKYDGTNDCLWVADYNGGSEIGKLSAANGSLLGTKNMGTNCYYPLGGIELEGVNLWAASYSPNAFQCFRLSDMALVRSVPVPSGWSYPCALAIGDSKWWATRYDYTVNRLNPTNGTVISSFASPDYMTYQFHMSYRNGSLWWGNRQSGYYNNLRKVDAATGVQQTQIQIGQFDPACTIHDVSFAGDTQLWLLTYHHLSTTYEYWAHLVDISGIQRLSKSAVSGAVPAGASAPVSLVFNGVGAGLGVWPVRLTISSNGGGPKDKLVTYIVHAPGVNRAPTANAGVDQTLDAVGVTTPVTLNGSGSSDPDGDSLRFTWRENGVVVTNVPNPALNLAPGVHDFTLTVDDYRGGVASDTVRITINAPDIAFVDEPVVMLCPQGSVVTQTVTVLNVGTRTLNWTMTEQLDGTNWVPILKSFKIGWNLSPSAMKFDATNNCLWAAYYYSNEVAKLSTANGSVLVRKYLTGCGNPYAIEMEGTNLWVANYSANNFSLYELGNASVLRTVAQPSGWSSRAWGMAMGGGNWYSTTSGTNVYRLNPSTGAVLATYPTPDSFSYYSKHFGYGEGSLWWGRSVSPGNALRRMDAASGQLKSSVQVGSWSPSTTIYDVSYTGTNSQYWVLTYYHNGAAEFWAHLIDLSNVSRVSDTPRSGSIAAGGSTTIQVTFDGRSLNRGSYPVQLLFTSNDPDEQLATNTVMVVVHTPGVNHPPVANAGPDRTQGIMDPKAPFIMDLSGAGSSDPDGDPIRCRWTTNGAPVVVNQYGLVELGVGANTFTLTVDDYRGGTNTDTMVLTVTNAAPRDWPEWYGPSGTGISPETNWLQNWPPIVAWRRAGMTGGGYGGNVSPVVSEGRVYYGATCLDAGTGNTIWSKGSGGNPTPAVDEDRVYTVGSAGWSGSTVPVSCWDKRTGSNIWNTTIAFSMGVNDSSYSGSPMVYGDLMYMGSAALNKYTGKTVWTRGSTYCNSGHIGRRHTWNGRTYILAADGYFIDPMTGVNGVYVGETVGWWLDAVSTYGSDKVWLLNSLKYINGSTIWSTNLSFNSEIYIQPTVVGDYGYFLSGCHGAGGPIICQDLRTGKELFRGPGWGTWIAADNRLIAHGGGAVAVIKAGVTNYVEEGPAYRFDPAGANNFSMLAFANKRIYIVGSSGLTCLYTGLAAPVVDNSAGAVWDDDAGVAVLNGELVNTGNGGAINTSAPPTRVFVYWGRSDGGTNAAAWEHCENLGAKTRGRFSASVPANSDAVCYYRCFATNNIGGGWAVGSERFTTYRRSWEMMGLVLHWPFEEGTGTVAADVSGNGNHASLVRDGNGNPVLRDVWTNGVAGKGVYLWGSEQARCMNVSPSLNSDFTFACWLSYTNTFDGNGSQNTLVTLANADAGSVSVVVSDASRTGWDRRLFGPYGMGSRKALHDGLWHHLAVVRQGMTYSMYVDGICNSSAAADIVANYNRLYVGWCVKYDDVRLYKRALSAEEVARLSAIGSATNGEGVVSGTTAATGSDDAEEKPNGAVVTDSWDLKLVRDGASNQVVGVRFPNAEIPSGAVIQSATIQFKSVRDPGGKRAILSQGGFVSFGTEDTPGATATVTNGGRTLTILGNAWKAHPFPYTVTTNTVLEFDYRSTMTGDVQGVGMDSQTVTTLTTRIFALYGSESRGISTYKNYSASAPNVKRYSIPIGKSYTGAMTHLVFMNDDDIGPTNAMSEYSDITVYEALPQSEPTCLTIRGQAADAPATFTAGVSNITARSLTDTAVEWIPPAWATNAMGLAQMTPDLAGIVQEMVSRPGWTTNSAPAFVIRGTGQRIADSIENPVGTAACLRVVWTPMGVPPALVCAWSTGDSNAVNARFDRPVLAATAVVAGNYRISGGIEVLCAAVTGDRTVVRLTTTRMTTGLVYRLTVSGIADLMTPPNCMTGSAETLFTCLPVPVQFVKKDTVTQGSWMGTYGHDQYSVIGDTANYCLYSYAQVTASGAGTYNWSNYTAEARALQRDEGGRIASAWYNSSGTNFTVDVNLTDGLTHQVAVYCLDWVYTNRSQKVDVVEPGTGRLWDSQTLGTNSFTNGVWLVWNITGRQILRFTDITASKKAVMSGIFFDPPARLAGPDENHNGIADPWEMQYYGTTNHTAAWFKTTDSDGDGVSDWQEYLAGTNPKSAASFLYVAGQPTTGTNGFTVRWSSATNQVYDLLRSTNLVDGFGACIGTNLPATPPMNVFTDKNVKANCTFYRVEVK